VQFSAMQHIYERILSLWLAADFLLSESTQTQDSAD